jgi:DNA-binding XRE family transcriptional regulator
VGTEWLRYEELGGPSMALADKVKALRNEQGWSQTELGER